MIKQLLALTGLTVAGPLSGDASPSAPLETNIFVDVRSPEDAGLRRAASVLIDNIERLRSIQTGTLTSLHKTLSFVEGDADSASVAELFNRAVDSSKVNGARLEDMWIEVARENQKTLGPLYKETAKARMASSSSQ